MSASDPLDELRAFLRSVDPLHPGRRVDRMPAELQPLAEDLGGMLSRLEDERRDAARRQLDEHEAERRDVAQRLHAEVGQLLTAALLHVDHARTHLGDPLPLDDARRAAQAALDAVQQLSRRLRPLILDDLGLSDALAALAVSVTRREGLLVRRDVDEAAAEALDREEAAIALRLVRDRLRGVARSRTATEVAVVVRHQDGAVEIAITDNGGDDADADVTTLRELAVAIGAQLAVGGAAGGTEVVLRVPR